MPASAVVTYQNLTFQPFWNVKNILDDRSNIPDPHPSRQLDRKFVYAREPDVNSADFEGYPLIILNTPLLAFPQRITGSRAQRLNSWEMRGEIRTSDFDPDALGRAETVSFPVGNGLQNLNQIMDDVLETLNADANRQTLRGFGMHDVEVEMLPFDEVIVEGQNTYFQEFVIRFTKFMDVTQ